MMMFSVGSMNPYPTSAPPLPYRRSAMYAPILVQTTTRFNPAVYQQQPGFNFAALIHMLQPLIAQLLAAMRQPQPLPIPQPIPVPQPIPLPPPPMVITPPPPPLPLPPPITVPPSDSGITGPLEDFYPVTPVLAMGGVPGGLLNITLEGSVIGAVAPGGSAWSRDRLVEYYTNSLNPSLSMVTDTTVRTGRSVCKNLYLTFGLADTSGDNEVDVEELKAVARRTGSSTKLELSDFQSLMA